MRFPRLALALAPVRQPLFSSAPSESTPFCVEVVSSERGADGFSKRLSRTCSSESVEVATRQNVSTFGTNSAASGTFLLVEYKDINFVTEIYRYYGQSGPCDYAGYYLRNYDYVATSVSSIMGGNGCTTILGRQFGGTELYKTIIPGASSIGSLNDNLYSLHVYRG